VGGGHLDLALQPIRQLVCNAFAVAILTFVHQLKTGSWHQLATTSTWRVLLRIGGKVMEEGSLGKKSNVFIFVSLIVMLVL